MMRSYTDLTSAGQLRRLRPLAVRVVEAYGLEGATLAPLTHGYNTTFRASASGGEQYVLRIQRPDGPSPAQLRSEMQWLAALRADTTLGVPEPLRTREGELLTRASAAGVPEERLCVLFRWMDGRFLDKGLTAGHLRKVGALTARLHEHARRFVPPEGFERGTVGHVTTFARGKRDIFSDEAIVDAAGMVTECHSEEGGRLVAAVMERARALYDELGYDSDAFGLIHGDLHQWNYLFHRGEVRVIDFDDCGYGPFVYDLMVTLYNLVRHPNYERLREAFLEGYETVRPLPHFDADDFDTLINLRRLQLMMWAVEEREQPLFRDEWRGDVEFHLQKFREYVYRTSEDG